MQRADRAFVPSGRCVLAGRNTGPLLAEAPPHRGSEGHRARGREPVQRVQGARQRGARTQTHWARGELPLSLNVSITLIRNDFLVMKLFFLRWTAPALSWSNLSMLSVHEACVYPLDRFLSKQPTGQKKYVLLCFLGMKTGFKSTLRFDKWFDSGEASQALTPISHISIDRGRAAADGRVVREAVSNVPRGAQPRLRGVLTAAEAEERVCWDAWSGDRAATKVGRRGVAS